MTTAGLPPAAPTRPRQRLRAWMDARLANRLSVWAATLTVGVMVVGLLGSLAAALHAERVHVDAELGLRADATAQQVVGVLDEIERGVHGVADSSFAVAAVAVPDAGDDALMTFLLEHRLVVRYGVELRLCDLRGTAIGTVRPRDSGDGLPLTPHPGCGEFPGYNEALAAGRAVARTTFASDGRAHIQLLVPVRSPSGMGHEGAVLADLLPAQVLRHGDGGRGHRHLMIVGDAGVLGGGWPAGHDADFAVVERPLLLPAASALQPLGLRMRVGMHDERSALWWWPIAAAYLAGMLLLAAIAVAVARRVARQLMAPIEALERVASDAATGAPVQLPAALSGGDEVARLSHCIKSMADSLQQSNAALQQSNAALSVQVTEQIEARQAAQAASVAKTEFLATMSHEIRTPMNAILGLSYLTLQGSLEDKQRDYLQKVHGAAQHLLGIINGILDFSKVEAGKLQLEREPFLLDDVLRQVIDTADIKARAKGLELRLEVTGAVPRRIVGDSLRLGQVLLNLCDNAIKFTERGMVLLSVEPMHQIGREVELVFCVGDTGVGIATAEQKRLFEAFTQADASTTRRHGGTGLGLAISLKLVELMGGHLGIQSQVGSGSTFHFNARFGLVPAEEHPETGPAPLQDEPLGGHRPALRGIKLLLAEDNELNQLLATELLGTAGIEVVVAGDGRQALDLLRAHPDVDLVLMDCNMPVMDGFAATRAIRADRRFTKLPVLAMTANVLPDDLASCRGAGMNDHIGKPIDVRQLFDALERWLPPRTARGAAAAPRPAFTDSKH